jgi:molybdopterin converting factor small subunit
VDGKDVRELEGLQTPVADGGEIRVIAAVAGG